MILEEIHNYILNNRIEDALNLLFDKLKECKTQNPKSVSDTNLIQNQLILISARNRDCNDSYNKGILKYDEYLQVKTQINNSIINLISDFSIYPNFKKFLENISTTTNSSQQVVKPISNDLVKKKIFMCHSSKDKAFVYKLASDLENCNIKIWIDEAEIDIGDSLINSIQKAISEMDYLAIILSPNSVSSNWVTMELESAMNIEISHSKVKVLPILYKVCEIPLFLANKRYADFTNQSNYDFSLKLLIKAVTK